MKKMKLMVFAVLLVFAGCKSKESALTLLRGQEWQLKSMTQNDAAVENPSQLPTLVFSDSSALYGSAGCNRFFGTYTTDEKGGMTIKTGGSTMMFCPDMAFEDSYLKALNQVKAYAVKDNELRLTGEEGKLLLVYGMADTTKLVGVAEDNHGCNAAAGFTWSEVRQNCIRIFETGVKMASVTDTAATEAAYVVFSVDSLKAEVFVPGKEIHPVLDRRELPGGGFAWNQEDDDTMNVRIVDDLWIVEQRGKTLWKQAGK